MITEREFKEKVEQGEQWVILDDQVVDVKGFASKHPGGAMLVRN